MFNASVKSILDVYNKIVRIANYLVNDNYRSVRSLYNTNISQLENDIIVRNLNLKPNDSINPPYRIDIMRSSSTVSDPKYAAIVHLYLIDDDKKPKQNFIRFNDTFDGSIPIIAYFINYNMFTFNVEMDRLSEVVEQYKNLFACILNNGTAYNKSITKKVATLLAVSYVYYVLGIDDQVLDSIVGKTEHSRIIETVKSIGDYTVTNIEKVHQLHSENPILAQLICDFASYCQIDALLGSSEEEAL